jgi:hypothetical protein
MKETGEDKRLVHSFQDRSRQVIKDGKRYILPHKFTPAGDVIDNSNFKPKRDLSRLSLDDFKLLATLQEKDWDLKAACEALGIDFEKASKRYKKLSYFEFEDKKAQALAAVATPAFVTSQNVEGFYRDHLSESQRDHLKELAKISGAYKNTTNVNVNFNAFLRPERSPEEERRCREFADTLAVDVSAG